MEWPQRTQKPQSEEQSGGEAGKNLSAIPSLRSARLSLRSLCSLWPTLEFGLKGQTFHLSVSLWFRSFDLIDWRHVT
jgi:hypothetical protein